MDNIPGLTITREYDGALLRIVIDRPKGNIFTMVLMDQLEAAIRSANNDQAAKCIVLEAGGKHFSFGAEVAEHRREMIGDVLASLHRLVMTIASSALPVAAIVQGLCLGGAFEVVAACHFVFASEDARFGLPEITLGVFPPVAAAILPMRISQAICDEMILSGASIEAQRLYDLGMIGQLSKTGSTLAHFDAWFEMTLLKYSASSLRFATRASRRTFCADLERELSYHEDQYVSALMASHDANEGIAAFLEKRQPKWTNA